jgi:plasmid stability protein
MNSMIQIRNVPEDLHRRLKARAAIEGISMSHYIMREIEKALEHPSRKELLIALRDQPETQLDVSPAQMLRQERDAR